jgi:zinc transporter, ZIP family
MAAPVFTVKNVPRKLLDAMLGFAAGVMIAASFWSLLAPSSYGGCSRGSPRPACQSWWLVGAGWVP